MFEKFLTTKEVAKMLGVTDACLEYQRWKGEGIPFIKLGGKRTVRYLESDVKAWMQSHKKYNQPKDGGSYGR